MHTVDVTGKNSTGALHVHVDNIGVIACFAVTFFTKSPKNLFPDYAEKLPRAFSSSSHSDKAAAVTGERIATQLELLQAP